jgi:hypothetical protein
MTTIDVRSENSVQVPGTGYGRLQSPRSYLPVSDVDRAKQFYRSLGRREDPHFPITENFRVVDMTPSGSAASIILGTGITAAEPGSAEASCLRSTWTRAGTAAPRGASINAGRYMEEGARCSPMTSSASRPSPTS